MILSPAERRVVAELARRGASNEEVAEALYVSVQTVKLHVSAAMAATGTRNRTELALWWVRLGAWVDLDKPSRRDVERLRRDAMSRWSRAA